jgi:hypothetical protein
MASEDFDSPGTIHQHGIGIVPDGNAMCTDFSAIMAPNPLGDGSTLFRGDVTSLGEDGFTINFTQGATGMRVYYLAISGFDHALHVGSNGSESLALGWKVLSCIGSTMFGGGADGIANINNFHSGGWGGGAYNPASSLNWTWGWMGAHSFPTSISSQGLGETFASSGTSPKVAQSAHFTGPFLIEGLPPARPTGVDLLNFNFSADPSNYVNHLIWDGASHWRNFSIPAPGAQASTHFGLLDAVEVCLTMSVSNSPNSAGAAAGFGIATDDFQCCVLVDATTSRGAYQSNENGWASYVDATQVRAGTMEFDGQDAILHEQEGGAVSGSLTGFGFLGPEEAPGFFRVVHR